MSKQFTRFSVEQCEEMRAGCWFQRKSDGTVQYFRIVDTVRGIESDY